MCYLCVLLVSSVLLVVQYVLLVSSMCYWCVLLVVQYVLLVCYCLQCVTGSPVCVTGVLLVSSVLLVFQYVLLVCVTGSPHCVTGVCYWCPVCIEWCRDDVFL